jgi:hypothetical protein
MECGEIICCTTESGNFVENNWLGSDVKLGNVKVQQKNINKFVLDKVIEYMGNVERR